MLSTDSVSDLLNCVPPGLSTSDPEVEPSCSCSVTSDRELSLA